MSTRRDFLKFSAVFSAGVSPWTASISQANTTTSASSVDTSAVTHFYKVIADQRRAASVQFAEQAQQQGYAVHLMPKGDITAFWYHELSAQWQRFPVAIAGLTEAGPLFCLEQLGAQFGMRVIHREEQTVAPDKPLLIAWVLAPGNSKSNLSNRTQS